MARIQQSIEIRVPVHAAYSQLTQFEDYSRFMADVETVEQIDDKRLHWKAAMGDRPVEWDAEITEQETDRCIAWHNLGGPTHVGKVEVQPVGTDMSRVTLTLDSDLGQGSALATCISAEEMAQRLKQDLARLKDFIEARGPPTGASRDEVDNPYMLHMLDRDAGEQAGGEAGPSAGQQQNATQPAQDRNAPVPASSYAAGSEGFAGNEESTAPVVSASHIATEQRNDSGGSVRSQQSPSSPGAALDRPQANKATRAAAEQRNDSAGSVSPRQSSPDAVRHVGQMPQDTSAERQGGASTSDAMGKSTQQGRQDTKDA